MKGGPRVSTVSYLRRLLERDERKFRYMRESGDPSSRYQQTKRRIANVTEALEREEARLLNPEAPLNGGLSYNLQAEAAGNE